MARDAYTFDQLAKYEVHGDGINLAHPANAALLERLQEHWRNKPTERSNEDLKPKRLNRDNTPVIVTNKYDVKKRYPNASAVAMSYGYPGADVIHKLISKGEELRGGLKVRYMEAGE
ncbi:hypothetical protein [Periweissella ghanensis]|uniref:Uncharacterized protein n=1 Tax=Periweissella ghanensis TaxID=467997 RepID=A0ABM8ZDK0_9LACO|nr:hypothetical protein [Periweissella ghanensis]MCM0600348.1 hypothetical protein [Periweissella ghanensis]CAH0419264.1 hypothetical protein WGH24286_01711 [Periweissella ghanensis]